MSGTQNDAACGLEPGGVYKKGDIVLVKLKGYHAWPARVEAVIVGPADKNHYHVFYYGTYDEGVVSPGLMCMFRPEATLEELVPKRLDPNGKRLAGDRPPGAQWERAVEEARERDAFSLENFLKSDDEANRKRALKIRAAVNEKIEKLERKAKEMEATERKKKASQESLPEVAPESCDEALPCDGVREELVSSNRDRKKDSAVSSSKQAVESKIASKKAEKPREMIEVSKTMCTGSSSPIENREGTGRGLRGPPSKKPRGDDPVPGQSDGGVPSVNDMGGIEGKAVSLTNAFRSLSVEADEEMPCPSVRRKVDPLKRAGGPVEKTGQGKCSKREGETSVQGSPRRGFRRGRSSGMTLRNDEPMEQGVPGSGLGDFCAPSTSDAVSPESSTSDAALEAQKKVERFELEFELREALYDLQEISGLLAMGRSGKMYPQFRATYFGYDASTFAWRGNRANEMPALEIIEKIHSALFKAAAWKDPILMILKAPDLFWIVMSNTGQDALCCPLILYKYNVQNMKQTSNSSPFYFLFLKAMKVARKFDSIGHFAVSLLAVIVELRNSRFQDKDLLEKLMSIRALLAKWIQPFYDGAKPTSPHNAVANACSGETSLKPSGPPNAVMSASSGGTSPKPLSPRNTAVNAICGGTTSAPVGAKEEKSKDGEQKKVAEVELEGGINTVGNVAQMSEKPLEGAKKKKKKKKKKKTTSTQPSNPAAQKAAALRIQEQIKQNMQRQEELDAKQAEGSRLRRAEEEILASESAPVIKETDIDGFVLTAVRFDWLSNVFQRVTKSLSDVQREALSEMPEELMRYRLVASSNPELSHNCAVLISAYLKEQYECHVEEEPSESSAQSDGDVSLDEVELEMAKLARNVAANPSGPKPGPARLPKSQRGRADGRRKKVDEDVKRGG